MQAATSFPGCKAGRQEISSSPTVVNSQLFFWGYIKRLRKNAIKKQLYFGARNFKICVSKSSLKISRKIHMMKTLQGFQFYWTKTHLSSFSILPWTFQSQLIRETMIFSLLDLIHISSSHFICVPGSCSSFQSKIIAKEILKNIAVNIFTIIFKTMYLLQKKQKTKKDYFVFIEPWP